MPKTYPNQKWIRVHKTTPSNNFLMISNSEWMKANKTLTPYGLQLYLFLAANANGYQFALSPEYAEESVGIKRTTFYAYLRTMEIHGYLVWRGGNTYDFYTSPRAENERTHPDHHADAIQFEDECPSGESAAMNESAQRKANPACEQNCSRSTSASSRSSIEIYNRYTDNHTDIDTNNAGKPRTPASSAADAADSPEQKQRIIVIPPPVSKPKKFVF